ncbi:MAG: hypothetical protein PHQ75_11120 [Thermoguttaceae bacterium]|nr:hypothetical protein [Thermoguttaceae bacterium]
MMKCLVWSLWTGAILSLSATYLLAAENWKMPVAQPGEVRLQVRSSVPFSTADMVKTATNPFPFEGFSGRNDRLVIESHNIKVTELAVVCDSSYTKTLQESSETSSRQLLTAIDQTVNAAKKHKITCLSLDCTKTQTVLAELKRLAITQVVFITDINTFGKLENQSLLACLKQTGTGAFLVRDLLPLVQTKGTSTPWRGREQAAETFERQGGMTITSADLTGKPAFRFQADKRPKICFLVSDDHYHAEKMFPLYGEYLMDHHDIYCVTVTGEGGPAFHPLEELDDADSLLIFFRRLPVPAVMKEKIERHLAQGKGLVGLRTSSHAFDPRKEVPAGYVIWPEFDHVVQGGNYHNHGPNDVGTDVVTVFGQEKHPLLAGIKPACWHSVGSLYFTGPVAEDAVILQVGSCLLKDKKNPSAPLQRISQPLTWLRYYGANRAPIACSSLGHPGDFNVPEGRELFTRLILWSMNRPLTGK